MNNEHKSQAELVDELAVAEEKIEIGANYRHYKSKDKIYRVMGLGFLESNDEMHVIYNAQYGENITFLRPLKVWLEQVEWEGQLVARFKKIG